MEAAGTVTVNQVQEMRASVQSMETAPPEISVRRRLPMAVIAGASGAALLALLMLGDGGTAGPETIQNVSEIMNEIGKVGAMSKGMTTGMSVFIILLPVVLSGLGCVWLYNGLVNKEEEVLASWAQVEASYQRRADLVPNLVASVKGFLDHEEKILTEVTHSRENALNAMKRAGKQLEDESAFAAMARAQNELGDGITRLFGLVENYPNFRSSDNFLALHDQLEGTENRINVARMMFNQTVREYNSAIRKMPGTLVAGMASFKRKAYFESDDGADKPVKVDF